MIFSFLCLQLWEAGEQAAAAPRVESSWSRLRGAAEQVQIAAARLLRGRAGLEAGYASVVAALKALMDSALAMQQQLASQNSAASFKEDRDAIVEQRAMVHRLEAQLKRKKKSTENLLSKWS